MNKNKWLFITKLFIIKSYQVTEKLKINMDVMINRRQKIYKLFHQQLIKQDIQCNQIMVRCYESKKINNSETQQFNKQNNSQYKNEPMCKGFENNSVRKNEKYSQSTIIIRLKQLANFINSTQQLRNNYVRKMQKLKYIVKKHEHNKMITQEVYNILIKYMKFAFIQIDQNLKKNIQTNLLHRQSTEDSLKLIKKVNKEIEQSQHMNQIGFEQSIRERQFYHQVLKFYQKQYLELCSQIPTANQKSGQLKVELGLAFKTARKKIERVIKLSQNSMMSG